jgi:hypothetical protein
MPTQVALTALLETRWPGSSIPMRLKHNIAEYLVIYRDEEGFRGPIREAGK